MGIIALRIDQTPLTSRGAAERRPDVAEADPEKAARINAAVPAHLAKLSQQYGFMMIYISTDYVFNGRK